jgi:hypothetical protein
LFLKDNKICSELLLASGQACFIFNIESSALSSWHQRYEMKDMPDDGWVMKRSQLSQAGINAMK